MDHHVEERDLSSYTKSLHREFGSLQTLIIVAMSLSTFTMLLRVYVRKTMVRIFGPEDWAMLVAFVFFLVHTSLMLLVFKFAAQLLTGRLSIWKSVEQIYHICYGFYILCLIVLKLSMGFFFLRILRHHTIQTAIIYVLCATVIVSGMIFFGFATFTCAQFRDIQSIRGKCAYQKEADVSNTVFSVLNILTGIVFVGLAVTPLVQSKMPRSTKIVASLILALGSIGCFASAVRLSLVLEPTDYMRWLPQFVNSGRWVITETTTGIVATNLALTRPLFGHLGTKFANMVSRQRSSATVTSSEEAAYLERVTKESKALKGEGETLVWIEKNVMLSASDTE
ncbi:Hypothetical protein D9617_26g078640 [Elsinoe fawcettii]|nr:Hypothetical protein D9617_26g078640 [Elsinoe fawcettii]